MTQTTKRIFEEYEVRKSKKQKSRFIDFVSSVAQENGYSCRVEKGSLGARNIVVGDPDTAKVIYTAHYDTCPVLPFPNFITPKNFIIYFVYQIVLSLIIVILPIVAVGYLTWPLADTGAYLLINYAVLIAILVLLLVGPANKHTANDNTSGVTTLLDIMNALPAESRDTVAFVFFDLEEIGLVGSASFYSKHKKSMKNKLLVNLDCVSDGENMIFAVRKGAKKFVPMLEQAFKSDNNVKVEILTKGVFYPSDQANFPCGVGVAALKCSKRLNILYMDRIHTRRDTVYREENIRFITEGLITLAELLKN